MGVYWSIEATRVDDGTAQDAVVLRLSAIQREEEDDQRTEERKCGFECGANEGPAQWGE